MKNPTSNLWNSMKKAVGNAKSKTSSKRTATQKATTPRTAAPKTAAPKTAAVKKKLQFSLSVRSKILISFLLPVLCVVLLGSISYKKSSESLIAACEQSTSQSIDAVSSYLTYAFDTISSVISEILTNTTTLQYAQEIHYKKDSGEYTSAITDITSYLNLKMSCNKMISNVTVVPTNFQVMTTAMADKTEGFFGDLNANGSYDFKSMGKWTSSHPDVDEKLNISPDSYALSYYRKYGTAKAAIFVDVDAAKLQEIMDGLDFGVGSMLTLVTPDGKELYYGDTIPDTAGFFQNQSFYTEAFNSDAANGYSYVDVNGSTYLYVYSKIGNGSMLCALIPQEHIISEALGIRNVTIGLVILAIIFDLLIGLYLSLSISRPIYSISKKLSKVATGDFTVDFSTRRKDEFGKLSQSIRETLVNIKELIGQAAQISTLVQNSATEVVSHSQTMTELAEQVNDAMEQVSATIESEANDTQSCVSDMDTLSQMIMQTTGNVDEINHFAVSTRQMIVQDIDTMSELTRQSEEASQIMASLLTEIQALEGKSKAVNEFVEVINSIASQTNLLSLNASIEAARAGEAGRGFAVVAEEIRKLSEESAKAANQIHLTANEITGQTHTTVTNVKTADGIAAKQCEITERIIKAFQELNQKMDALMEKVSQITIGMDEMSGARVTALDAISNISASTEETYSLSSAVGELLGRHDEASKTLVTISEELKVNAYELKEAINRFKL